VASRCSKSPSTCCGVSALPVVGTTKATGTSPSWSSGARSRIDDRLRWHPPSRAHDTRKPVACLECPHSAAPEVAHAVQRELAKALLGHEQLGPGRLDEHAQLGRWHAVVERDEDRAKPRAAEHERQQFGAVGTEIPDAVSGGDAPHPQPSRQRADVSLELGVADLTLLEAKGRLLGHPACPMRYPDRDVHAAPAPVRIELASEDRVLLY
jgi:hypothetical protein